jgi:catechol 2,3-dioxygenase-like lactoylglutathione lyase family enzyme
MIIIEGIDHISIPVTNLKVSSKFYSDLFDFEVTEKTDTYMLLFHEVISIRLVLTDAVNTSASSKLIPLLSFSMDVDDFTEAISELEASSIKILKGPETTNEGEYIIFPDPDNHLIEIFYND